MVIFNESVTIGCQCHSELMVPRYIRLTQIHGHYGQVIEREDIDKLCCLIYTGNIKNNYVKHILLHTDTPKTCTSHVSIVNYVFCLFLK